MEEEKLKELIDNRNKKRPNSNQLIELIKYYEVKIDTIDDLHKKIILLHENSDKHQKQIKDIDSFYNEFFSVPQSETDIDNKAISKIENFKNLQNDIIEKSKDVENSYKELSKTIPVLVGEENKEEEWLVATHIARVSKNISNIKTYEKQLEDANKQITVYTDILKNLKSSFEKSDKEIKNLINPAVGHSLSVNYKETKENDYKKNIIVYGWKLYTIFNSSNCNYIIPFKSFLAFKPRSNSNIFKCYSRYIYNI